MDPSLKLAQHRLGVLELAEALGNVASACRQRQISRTQFYEYKRRFQTHGIEGLRDLPPVHKTHPQTTPAEVVDRILELALQNPAHGCKRISNTLAAQGVLLSSVTVHSILTKHQMGTRYARWLALERRNAEQTLELTASQVAFLERENPQFAQRHVESTRPGELLNQDTFFVGTLKGVGKVWLHAIVDTYSSYAFGFLFAGKRAEAAVAVLHNDVLPFYEKIGLTVEAILTDNGTEFCGTENHPYELYCDLNEIHHRTTKIRSPRTNGFIERFNRTVLDEFFRHAFRRAFYDSVDVLQQDLDSWLSEYNTQRPHQGYRNMGRRPWETIQLYLDTHSPVYQEA
jgi:transposase InsO family protein